MVTIESRNESIGRMKISSESSPKTNIRLMSAVTNGIRPAMIAPRARIRTIRAIGTPIDSARSTSAFSTSVRSFDDCEYPVRYASTGVEPAAASTFFSRSADRVARSLSLPFMPKVAMAADWSLEIWPFEAAGSYGLTTATTSGWPFTAFNTWLTTSSYVESVAFTRSELKTMMSCSAPAAVKSVPIIFTTSAESDPVTL